MHSYHLEGILLRRLAYQENHHILTFLTPQEGLFSLFSPSTHKRQLSLLNDPLGRYELTFSHQKERGMARLRDLSSLDPPQEALLLRRDWKRLVDIQGMAQALLASQQEGIAAPTLYALACAYRGMVASRPSPPEALLPSFLIKLLIHEGYWALPERCVLCSLPLHQQPFAADLSGNYCLPHSPLASVAFTDTEQKELLLLTSRSSSTLLQINLNRACEEKITALYKTFFSY